MTAPPSGAAAPQEMRLHSGAAVALVPLAGEICNRYRAEFGDEAGRYGEAGTKWCRHDNQYLLAWAIQEARDDTVRLSEQVDWLADVLEARAFPLERLARDLEIAAEVATAATALGTLSAEVGSLLRAAANQVKGRVLP